MLALAVALTGTATPASAQQNFFDILFGNRVQRQRVQERPPVEVAPAPPVAAPKISAPKYYTYNPEPLAKVDFAALTSSPAQGEDAPAPTAFAEALAGLADFELLAEKKIAEALVDHYSRHPEFMWVAGEGRNERADAVLRVLDEAGSFGLSESDYVVNLPHAPIGAESAAARKERLNALIRFEMTLSARALRYARDAYLGRVDPNKLSGYHDLPRKPLVEARVLEVLSRTPEPAGYLESLHPRNELYATLREELKTLRASAEKEIVVDPETFVRPGGSHSDFPNLLRIIERDADAAFRAEHGPALAAHAGSETYAQELVPVIKAAQKLHDLNPDGVVGPRTVGALAGESKSARIDKVLLALERLRWHPTYLGNTRVMINAASFTADYIEDGESRLSMRAVVGTRSNQTSFFHDEIEFVEFNPYWGVPRSILVNEKLPRLRRDPGYLDRAGYEVTDSRGRRVSSASVDWSRYGANIPFNVRQKPGPSNALGELKIMFPNKHDIYMHDTPAKELFSRDTRAYSHGCVRLHDPRAMAAAVLRTTVDDVAQEIGKGRNGRRDVPRRIPVYVGYFTAWPEPAGGVSYHGDVYGRDASLRKALTAVEEARVPGS